MKLLAADAGPLIFLAKLGRLNLLTEADVRIPAAVMAEISAKADEACKQIEQAANFFLKVVKVKNRAACPTFIGRFGFGKSGSHCHRKRN